MTDNAEKAYVVVRADLSPGYQIVQAAHAVAEHERAIPGSMAGRTMVVLSVASKEDLLHVYNRFTRQGIGQLATRFFEPDIQEYTAFAASPSYYWDEFVGLPLAGS